MGGTCVIRGCVPKEALMVFASATADLRGTPAARLLVIREGASTGPLSAANLKRRTSTGSMGVLPASCSTARAARSTDARADADGPHHDQRFSTGETVTAKTILVATGGHSREARHPHAHLGIQLQTRSSGLEKACRDPS